MPEPRPFSFSVGERKIMNHFVVKALSPLATPFVKNEAITEVDSP
jgi:hypothetical protein